MLALDGRHCAGIFYPPTARLVAEAGPLPTTHRYHRPAETYKGMMYPEQRETVVILMPDSWNHCPSVEAAVTAWQVRPALLLPFDS